MSLTLGSVSKLFTIEVLEDAVRRALEADGRPAGLKVVGHSVELGADKGTGYLGVVYRIRVQLSDGSELSLIAKGMPENVVRRKTFRCDYYFEKEVFFFTKVAPLFREFELKQRGVEKVAVDTYMPIARCYHAVSDGENDFLVFQDLKTLGYEMTDRVSGPTVAQRQGLLHTLARFHALSYGLLRLEPEKLASTAEAFPEPWFSQPLAPFYEAYMFKLYNIWKRALQDELQGTDYWRKFLEFGPDAKKLFENMCDAMRHVGPAVINHGDAWSTNFLFGRQDEIMMIDFQIMRHASPMTDVSLFIFSCTTEEQRADAGGMLAILDDYYQVLCRSVKELGLDECPLSWEQLLEQWRVNGRLGFSSALELVLLSVVETEDVQDLDRIDGNEPVPLVDITQFKDVTDPEGRKRLADLTRLAADFGMI
ncbi:uncharacterized protein LOC135935245 [Cloeon dipterum]|uniref:uncharacterized protein LOC135935245 n=1 Tax=Cloeon dipterum TaxID=197152 RepID=UPI00321FCF79